MSANNETDKKLCRVCLGCYDATTTEFYPHQSTSDGLDNACKACNLIAQKKARSKNKERLSAYGKEYRQANNEKIMEYQRRYRATHSKTISEKRSLRNAGKVPQDRYSGLSRHRREVSCRTREKVAKWVSENPLSDVKACSIGAGVSWRTANKYAGLVKGCELCK